MHQFVIFTPHIMRVSTKNHYILQHFSSFSSSISIFFAIFVPIYWCSSTDILPWESLWKLYSILNVAPKAKEDGK